MSLRVQEVSVDGSFIHPEHYGDAAKAAGVAAGIAARASEQLLFVKVMDDRTTDWRLIDSFPAARRT